MQENGKAERLAQLVSKRKMVRRDGYARLGDFQDGIFECGYLSPWTKSGHNLDAFIMIIGQDWVSGDVLANYPADSDVAALGFDAKFPTNSNLNELLKRHFGLARSECYLTNLFVLIKPGSASAPIPFEDLVWSAQEFTIPEIRIVSPRLAICLGLRTFRALRRASGHKGALTMEQAIAARFPLEGAMVHCVAHTGAFGMNNRSRGKVEEDWQKLADSYAAGPAAMTA